MKSTPTTGHTSDPSRLAFCNPCFVRDQDRLEIIEREAATDPRDRYRRTRSRSIELCRPLAVEDHSAQPVVDVSPPKWHLGHTTWFFEQFLLRSLPHYQADEQVAFMFNSYYEGAGARVKREHRGHHTRPTVQEVLDYRSRVDEAMDRLLGQELSAEQLAVLELGLNHEEQHQELLITDIKYILCQEPLFPAYGPFNEGWDEKPVTGPIEVPGGLHHIGHDGEGFTFDVEHGRHQVHLEPFKIASRLVTNREWMGFIQDGGYSDHRHWHSEGWQWVRENGVKAPMYWYERDGVWHWFSLQGLVPVDPDMPVAHISFYEAFAFSQWSGRRLPTEQEWEVASPGFRWGQRWEWTHSAFLPYPGYRRAEGAIGEYNGKFMVNQMVLRGASVATSPGHSRHTYRNFFHPHLRWQYTGLRLVETT
jgi:ergothioneine biosynthesis protein EgtB